MTDLFVSQFMKPGYEPGDGSMDGAMLVDAEWWHPLHGCDSLQNVLDGVRYRMVLTDSRSVLTKKSLQALVDSVVPNMPFEAETYTNEAVRLNRMSIRKQLLDFIDTMED
jgi:hypothetical protein